MSQVLTAQTPLEAKLIVDHIPETAECREGIEILLKAVIDRTFDENPELANRLIGSGVTRLMEATNNIFYGIGPTVA